MVILEGIGEGFRFWLLVDNSKCLNAFQAEICQNIGGCACCVCVKVGFFTNVVLKGRRSNRIWGKIF